MGKTYIKMQVLLKVEIKISYLMKMSKIVRSVDQNFQKISRNLKAKGKLIKFKKCHN